MQKIRFTYADSQQPHHQQIQHALQILGSAHAELHFEGKFVILLLLLLQDTYIMFQRMPCNQSNIYWSRHVQLITIDYSASWANLTKHTG